MPLKRLQKMTTRTTTSSADCVTARGSSRRYLSALMRHSQKERANILHFNKSELTVLLKAASKDTTLYNINSVDFGSDRMVSTDGHRLCKIEAPEDRHSGIDKPFAVAREYLERIVKVMGKDSIARVAAKPDDADPVSPFGLATVRTIEVDGTEFHVPQLECDYPDYKQVIPKAEQAVITIGFNAAYLRDLCDPIIKAGVSRGNCMKLRISDDLSPVAATADTDGGSIEYVVMPIRIN